MPIYNGEKYMRQSIESVINQTYKNWELIIIDDCSKDSTPEIAKEFANKDKRINYYRNKNNLKLPRSINRGFSIAKGNYLTWTSDDNLYLPTAIDRMVSAINSEKADFVFATCDVINENGEIIEIIKAPKDYKDAIVGGNFVGACFLYTRRLYETVGDYDVNKFLVEDYDYWLRIFYRFNVYNIEDILYQYRWHDGALTSTEKKDRINSICEKVLLENVKNYGCLSLKQKYYLYSHLQRLRQTKDDKDERDKYKTKSSIYRCFYILFFNLPDKMKRLLKRKSNQE